MRKVFLILFFFPCVLYAQNTTKAKKAYAKAVEFYEDNNDKKAKDLALSAVRQDENYLPSYLLLGQLEEEGGNIELAIDNYLKGISDNKPDNAWGYWKVGMLHMQIPNYVEAQRAFNHFLTFKYQNSKKIESARKELKNCEFSIDAIANPEPFDFKNMGDGINSEWENVTSVSADGKLFVITRRGYIKTMLFQKIFIR